MKKSSNFKFQYVLFCLLIPSLNAWSNIIYVDVNSATPGDGSSWSVAYSSLQDGLSSAANGDTIVVAAGTYTPHASDRAVSFELIEGVVMLGGFSGNEPAINQTTIESRDFDTNPTILSGDLAGNDAEFTNRDDNSYHVVFSETTASSISNATVVDGFTITGSNADYFITSQYDDLRGGGIFLEANAPEECSPTFRNIIVEGNSAQFGAAVSISSFNNGGICSPVFENFVFRDNRCIESDDTQISGGGALIITTTDGVANPVFQNGIIINNEVVPGTYNGTGGGAIISASIFASDAESSPQFTNVLFCSNKAPGGGSHINNQAQGTGASVKPVFTNVTLAGYVLNSPVYNYNGGNASAICNPQFINSLIHTTNYNSVVNAPSPASSGPNPSFAYCNIRGSMALGSWSPSYGVDAGNNMEEIPAFFDTTKCDVRLYSTSPELGTGNATFGQNIGYYQGPGLVYLDIQDIADFSGCSSENTFHFKMRIDDEAEDSASYSIVTTGILNQEHLSDSLANDTLYIALSLPDTLFGTGLVTIHAENLQNETDSTDFNFTLGKSPVIPGYSHGYFNLADTTYGIALHLDTTIVGETYTMDGISSGNIYFDGLEPGYHYGLSEYNGCVSDTLHINLPEYINEVPLEIVNYNDTALFTFCSGDTTLRLEFSITDDNPDLISWRYSLYYAKVIPDSNITFHETDSSYYFEVVIPDTLGYYQLHIHAENIYLDMANLYYEIYLEEPAVVDTVFIDGQDGYYCIYPQISNYEYSYQLEAYLNGTPINSFNPTCGLAPGEYTLEVFYMGCNSELYTFLISEEGNSNSIDKVTHNNWNIYPNPGSEFISIESVSSINAIQIFSLTGEKVIDITNYTKGEKIDVSNLSEGIYLVNILVNNTNHIQKLTIVH